MNKFISLFKVELLNNFSLNSMFSKNKKNKKKSSGLKSIIILYSFLFLFSLLYSYIFYMSGKDINKTEMCLAFGISYGTLFSMFMSFASAYSTLFKSKDYELLMSLPLSSKFVVLSKIVSIMFMTFSYFALMFFPSILIYFILNFVYFKIFSLVSLLACLIIIIVHPLLISALFSFIAFLFGLIISKFKHKNAISSILYTLFFIGLMVFVYFSSYSVGYSEGSSDYDEAIQLYNTIVNMFPFTSLIIDGILNKFLYIFLYGLASLIIFYIFSTIIGKFYLKINASNKLSYKSSDFDINKNNKTQSQTKALFIKELKTFLTTPIYLSNCILGPIMSLLITILLSIKLNSEELETINYLIPSILLPTICFFNGIAPTTSCAISIEGNKFWITKSMPIDAKKILNSKLLLNFVLYAPFSIIGSIISIIVLRLNILDSIIMLLMPLFANIMYGNFGLLTNLKHYNLKWTNVNIAIKQGSNSLLAGLLDIAISLLLFSPIIISISINKSLLVVEAILIIILFIISNIMLNNQGIKRYNSIEM